ncbi:MAG TPA: hypothetical protein PK176_02875 [Acidobacteriota bacterium]|nr:hypothetical protein [Acidobacteriota bacterium]HQM62232.1 hypothetical protein [Acidobacteriota bacterium]
MDKSDPKLSAFRAGDMRRGKPARDSGPGRDAADLRHYPFLEKLLEADESTIEQFQTVCQNTCRNLDTSVGRQSDPAYTAMGQAALSAYGHSLKLLAELLEIKYEQLRQQAEKK